MRCLPLNRHHIVTNYDRLAHRTVFLHGRQASCGFFTAAEHHGGHLLLNVSIIDYVTHQFFSESKDPLNRRSKRRLPQVFMPLTARFDANLTIISFRSGFADLSQQENGTIKQSVQRPVSPFATGDVGDHWLPWEQMDFANFIARQYKGTAGGVPYTLRSFFKMVFGRPPPNVIYYAQGGVFAAAPDAIRFIPRRTYEFIMREIEAGHEELVYLLEVTWWYLLGGEMEDESIPALNLPRNQLLPTLSHLRQVAHRHLSDENGYVLRDPPSPPLLPPSPLAEGVHCSNTCPGRFSPAPTPPPSPPPPSPPLMIPISPTGPLIAAGVALIAAGLIICLAAKHSCVTCSRRRVWPAVPLMANSKSNGEAYRIEPGTAPSGGPNANAKVTSSKRPREQMVASGNTEEIQVEAVQPTPIGEEMDGLPAPKAWSPSRANATSRTDYLSKSLVEASLAGTSVVAVPEDLEVRSISGGDPASALASPR